MATEDKIIGTWVYEEPAVVLSSDDMLKNIGGKRWLLQAVEKLSLKSKLEGYGFKKGSVTMTFDKSGNFTRHLWERKLPVHTPLKIRTLC